MARRIDKIEKEIGYCQIKLEKERRARKQAQFLQDDIALLDQLLERCTCPEVVLPAILQRHDGSGGSGTTRDDFLAVGLVEILREEREILDRELQELVGRAKAFTGAEGKQCILEDEKRSTLKRLSPAHSSRFRRIEDGLKKAERQWNHFTEDLVNLHAGIRFLERNLDYLRSCRTFLLSAKRSSDIDLWTRGSPLSITFRHSSIGRAKEMATGADRNLKLAQKELVCLASVRPRPELFQRVLIPLLEALFTDIFIDGKLDASFRVVEAALASNLKLTEGMKEKRMLLEEKAGESEKRRDEMFSRLGANRQGWMMR